MSSGPSDTGSNLAFSFLSLRDEATSRQRGALLSMRSMQSPSPSSDALTYGAYIPLTRNQPAAAPFWLVEQSRKASDTASSAAVSRRVTLPSFRMYPSPRFTAACISAGERPALPESNVILTSKSPPAASHTSTTGTTDCMSSVKSARRLSRSTIHPLLRSAGRPVPRKVSTFCWSVMKSLEFPPV